MSLLSSLLTAADGLLLAVLLLPAVGLSGRGGRGFLKGFEAVESSFFWRGGSSFSFCSSFSICSSPWRTSSSLSSYCRGACCNMSERLEQGFRQNCTSELGHPPSWKSTGSIKSHQRLRYHPGVTPDSSPCQQTCFRSIKLRETKSGICELATRTDFARKEQCFAPTARVSGMRLTPSCSDNIQVVLTMRTQPSIWLLSLNASKAHDS